MTAKEALRDWVDELTEEEAAALLRRIVKGNEEFEPLSPEQLASIERGIAQTDAGLGIPHESCSGASAGCDPTA